jgi:hypothetical protein
MVSININTHEIEAKFAELPQALMAGIRQEMKQQVTEVQSEARKNHRYMSTSGVRPSGRYYRNTGNLEKSVQTKVNDEGTVGEVYLDSGIADYGIYVHEGHGSWAPDKFLDDALMKRETEIREKIEEAIKVAISKAGF